MNTLCHLKKGSSLPLAFIDLRGYFFQIFPQITVSALSRFYPLTRAADRAVIVYPEMAASFSQGLPAITSHQINRHVSREILGAAPGLAQFIFACGRDGDKMRFVFLILSEV
jgi:hypothetical protein